MKLLGTRCLYFVVAVGLAMGLGPVATGEDVVDRVTGEFDHSAIAVAWAAKKVVEDHQYRVIWESAAGDSIAVVPLEDTKWQPGSYLGHEQSPITTMWSNPAKSRWSSPSVPRPEPKIDINGVDVPAPQVENGEKDVVVAVLMTITNISARRSSVQFVDVSRKRDPITRFWLEEDWQVDSAYSVLIASERDQILKSIHKELGDKVPKTDSDEWYESDF